MTQLINVALPTVTRAAGSKYAFDQLEVNGPALVEVGVVQASKVASRLQSALAAAKKRNPELKARKFKVRVFMHEGQESVGVWRTE